MISNKITRESSSYGKLKKLADSLGYFQVDDKLNKFKCKILLIEKVIFEIYDKEGKGYINKEDLVYIFKTISPELELTRLNSLAVNLLGYYGKNGRLDLGNFLKVGIF